MDRKTLLWTGALGLTGFTLGLVLVIARDVTWSWPLVMMLALVLILPPARAYGSAHARAAGTRLRERRREG